MEKLVTSLDDCEIIEDIGFGSFGKTWLAKTKPTPTLGEIAVVIKEVDPEFIVEVCGVSCTDLIFQEWSSMEYTKHPNLLKSINVFIGDGKIYHVQEYCSDGNLQMWIDKQNGHLVSDMRIQLWFGQIVNGLSFLHDKQLLHCSVKAQNILVYKQSILKLTDAGTAHLLLTSQKDVVNESVALTLLHYPPEVFLTSDERSGIKIDVWMMGVVVYHMLTLKLPFPRGTGDEMRDAIVNTEPPPISDVYPKELGDLLAHMLRKNPDERASMTEIVDNVFLNRIMSITGRRLRRESSRKVTLIPTSEQIHKHLKETENLGFHKKWSKNPHRTLVKSPSPVRAVLAMDKDTDKYESLMLVCVDGELVVLSPIDFYDSIQFISRVYIDIREHDSKDKFGIFHAVYDAKLEAVFFILISPHRDRIYYITKSEITPDLTGHKRSIRVRLHTFTPSSVTGNRLFLGLTVDSDKRLLYAGIEKPSKQISVWSIAKLKPENYKQNFLLGVISCDDVDGLLVEPRYLSYTHAGHPKLAVIDYLNNKICIFHIEEQEDESEVFTMPRVVMKKIVAVKNNESPLEIGAVYGPCDVTFDSAGHLILADYSNKRLQMFTFRDDNEMVKKLGKATTTTENAQVMLRGVWSSDRILGGPYRLAIIRGIEPLLIVAQFASSDVLCFR